MTLNITGTRKEIESYFKLKLTLDYIKELEKKLSKEIKSQVIITAFSEETGEYIWNEPQYNLAFESFSK